MTNEIIAEYVHWRDTRCKKEFVIMWSDHTWETIRCPFTDYWIGNKSYKQYMELNKGSSFFAKFTTPLMRT